MAINIKDKSQTIQLQRHLDKAKRQNSDAMEKLSSGQVFTRQDPRPAERALAEGLEFKLRSLSGSKRNINSAVNLLQTAESSLSEITNMILRMKEISTAAANTTVSDRERRFLFIEYEALHDEINRVAITTEYNGLPLLNGEDENSPDELIFRMGDPVESEFSDVEDVNTIRFSGLQSVQATTEGLGIKSAKEILSDTTEQEGLTIEDVEDLIEPDDNEFYSTTFDQALNVLSTQRAVFGAMQARLNRAIDYMDVYQENLTAAKSAIADTDFAKETVRMVESRILMQAGTAMLAQGNINANLALNLINSLV